MAGFNLNDFGFSAKALECEYGQTTNAEHPSYPRSLWTESVTLGRKVLGDYWSWVKSQLDDELSSLNEESSGETQVQIGY